MASKPIDGKKKGPTPLAKAYLTTYNVISAMGWAYILVSLIIHLFSSNQKIESPATKGLPLSKISLWLSPFLNLTSTDLEHRIPTYLERLYRHAQTTYFSIGSQTAFVQSFAILEVLHVALGWVRSPLPTTLAQVASRLFLIYGVTEQFAHTRSHPAYTSMVFAWSTVEVIRYSFYACNLMGHNADALLWLRYTAFYVLYPLGASSEATLIHSSLPSSLFTFSPQSLFGASWKVIDYFRALLFIIWWPGLYVLYAHMIRQRHKVLGSRGSKVKFQ